MPRRCGFYPGICLTTEEKTWKNLSQGSIARHFSRTVLGDLLARLFNDIILAFMVYILEKLFKTGVQISRAPSRRGDKFCTATPNSLSITTAVVFLTCNNTGTALYV